MKLVHLATGISLAALSGCMVADRPDVSTVVDPLIGKSLTAENGTVFVFRPNGTMGGVFRGKDVVGSYTATDSEVCSTYTAPAQLAGQEFCSMPQISGKTVIFKRRDGSTSALYTIGM